MTAFVTKFLCTPSVGDEGSWMHYAITTHSDMPGQAEVLADKLMQTLIRGNTMFVRQQATASVVKILVHQNFLEIGYCRFSVKVPCVSMVSM